ncbi:MAG TPA: YggS family pyridoxal phosphate-dependent enzyme [Bacteroidota bacterium]|nr:YggS family pyridoxal phosphate-dependent enzyme [Bacteroidota bacterium]
MFKPQMIAENVKNIQERIKKSCIAAGRDPDSVALIAVSKTFGFQEIEEVVKTGLLDIGENYVQEVKEKRLKVTNPEVRWHFLGHLQSNKVKFIADWIHMIHSVDSESVAAEIQRRGAGIGRTIDVLIEVNTSGEHSKFGVAPNAAIDLIRKISTQPNIRVQGLMTIGAFMPDPEQSRASFRMLRTVFDEINSSRILHEPLKHLSMGMTHDFTVAIEEGSTMVRIGTAIFGTRPKPNVH